MDDPHTLKEQAAKCRRLLDEITDVETRQSLSKLAEEYDARCSRAQQQRGQPKSG